MGVPVDPLRVALHIGLLTSCDTFPQNRLTDRLCFAIRLSGRDGSLQCCMSHIKVLLSLVPHNVASWYVSDWIPGALVNVVSIPLHREPVLTSGDCNTNDGVDDLLLRLHVFTNWSRGPRISFWCLVLDATYSNHWGTSCRV